MKWKTHVYFDTVRPKKHPELSEEQAAYAADHFIREAWQEDGRLRRWAFVPELDRYVRVVIEPDGETLFNAFIDRSFKP